MKELHFEDCMYIKHNENYIKTKYVYKEFFPLKNNKYVFYVVDSDILKKDKIINFKVKGYNGEFYLFENALVDYDKYFGYGYKITFRGSPKKVLSLDED